MFYNKPESADVQGRDSDEQGGITADWLARNTPLKEATYYLCGPRPFLPALVGSLARTGVPLGRIQYEFFGPGRRTAGCLREASQGRCLRLGLSSHPDYSSARQACETLSAPRVGPF